MGTHKQFVEASLTRLLQKVDKMASTLAQVVAELDALKTSDDALVTEITQIVTDITAAITDMQGASATIASLKAQLATALQNAADPAVVQALLDGLTALQAKQDATTTRLTAAAASLVDAIKANPGT